ncbi:MAG: hypothetical protein ACREEP_20590, partial [Dongiaceae bacterium]
LTMIDHMFERVFWEADHRHWAKEEPRSPPVAAWGSPPDARTRRRTLFICLTPLSAIAIESDERWSRLQSHLAGTSSGRRISNVRRSSISGSSNTGRGILADPRKQKISNASTR